MRPGGVSPSADTGNSPRYGGDGYVDPKRLALHLMDLAWALAGEVAQAGGTSADEVLRGYALAFEEET